MTQQGREGTERMQSSALPSMGSAYSLGSLEQSDICPCPCTCSLPTQSPFLSGSPNRECVCTAQHGKAMEGAGLLEH